MATVQSITSKPNGFPQNIPHAVNLDGASLPATGDTLYPPHSAAAEFGLRVVSDFMSPAYETGDIILCRSLRKGERLSIGGDYVFATEAEGGRVCVLARLTGRTQARWLTLQHKGNRRPLPVAGEVEHGLRRDRLLPHPQRCRCC